jgi:aldehyde:ferredoxin oxidoreductase
MFADNQRELKVLAEAIRNQDPNVEIRVELMSGGEVLGTALVMWLKNAEDEIEVARRVVKTVWPRMGTKRSQTHPEWAESCNTKMDLVTKIESWLRTNSARCDRHLIKLEYLCPGCQLVCALYATTQKAEHSVHGVRSLSRKYQMGTNTQNQTALLGHNVSISMPWESNGLKR